MKKITLHLAFWMAFFFIWRRIAYFYIDDAYSQLLFTLLDILSLAIPFYLIFGFARPVFSNAHAKVRFVIIVSTALAFSGLLTAAFMHLALQEEWIAIRFDFKWNYKDLVFNRYFMVLLGGLSGFVIKLSLDWYDSRQRIHILEKENKVAEMQALKAQINPHFLFNTLNTIYIQMEIDTTAAKYHLHALSHLLQYQLYASDKDKVPLRKELDYLANYIALQQVRKEGICIQVQMVVDNESLSIAPLLMINLIENAFKYVSAADDQEEKIAFQLHTAKGILYFEAFNTIAPGQPLAKAGLRIGLDNVRKRLALLYPHKHQLALLKQDHSFTVTLQIDLNK